MMFLMSAAMILLSIFSFAVSEMVLGFHFGVCAILVTIMAVLDEMESYGGE